MGSLLFSFKGRINASQLLRGFIVVIIISFILGMIPYFSIDLWWLSSFGIVLIWPWLALFAKRYHDAGKSGWLALLPLVVSFAINFGVGQVLSKMIPIDTSASEEMAASGDVGGAMTAAIEASMPHIIPGAIAGVVITLAIVFLFNAMIKSDPEENQFGAPTN